PTPPGGSAECCTRTEDREGAVEPVEPERRGLRDGAELAGNYGRFQLVSQLIAGIEFEVRAERVVAGRDVGKRENRMHVVYFNEICRSSASLVVTGRSGVVCSRALS